MIADLRINCCRRSWSPARKKHRCNVLQKNIMNGMPFSAIGLFHQQGIVMFSAF